MKFHPADTAWTLDPRGEIPGEGQDLKTGVQRGIGNQVSVEFNLMYRFHSPVSSRDREWTEGFFKMFFDSMSGVTGQTFTNEEVANGDIPVTVLKATLDHLKGKGKTDEEKKKVLDDLAAKPHFPEGLEISDVKIDNHVPKFSYKFNRGPDGKFDDRQLVEEMLRVMEDPICRFGAQNIPKVFRSIEILGMLQARKWEIATLNEFREFFGLERHKTFEDINEDEEVANNLRDLYEDPGM